MILDTGNTTATVLARFARANLAGIQRAAFRIRYGDEESVAMALFGNDNYAGDESIRQEVETIRLRLAEGNIEELGFGLSQDGHTWAMLLRVNMGRYRTGVGQAFQIEMAKVLLDDIIRGASRAVGEVSPESAVWVLKNCGPTA